MKLRLLIALASAVLILAPIATAAFEGQQPAGASSQTLMQNANESAQATTDISYGDADATPATGTQAVRNVSYGGVSSGRVEAGGRDNLPCSGAAECKIYFGR